MALESTGEKEAFVAAIEKTPPSALLVLFRAGVSKQACGSPGVDFPDGEELGFVAGGIPSPAVCRRLCLAASGCTHYFFWTSSLLSESLRGSCSLRRYPKLSQEQLHEQLQQLHRQQQQLRDERRKKKREAREARRRKRMQKQQEKQEQQKRQQRQEEENAEENNLTNEGGQHQPEENQTWRMQQQRQAQQAATSQLPQAPSQQQKYHQHREKSQDVNSRDAAAPEAEPLQKQVPDGQPRRLEGLLPDAEKLDTVLERDGDAENGSTEAEEAEPERYRGTEGSAAAEAPERVSARFSRNSSVGRRDTGEAVAAIRASEEPAARAPRAEASEKAARAFEGNEVDVEGGYDEEDDDKEHEEEAQVPFPTLLPGAPHAFPIFQKRRHAPQQREQQQWSGEPQERGEEEHDDDNDTQHQQARKQKDVASSIVHSPRGFQAAWQSSDFYWHFGAAACDPPARPTTTTTSPPPLPAHAQLPNACEEHDADYYGHDLSRRVALSSLECQEKCKETEACQGYTFLPRQRICLLKWMLLPRKVPHFISGPRCCEQTPEAALLLQQEGRAPEESMLRTQQQQPQTQDDADSRATASATNHKCGASSGGGGSCLNNDQRSASSKNACPPKRTPMCLWPGKGLPGNDLGPLLKECASAAECQLQCDQHLQCGLAPTSSVSPDAAVGVDTPKDRLSRHALLPGKELEAAAFVSSAPEETRGTMQLRNQRDVPEELTASSQTQEPPQIHREQGKQALQSLQPFEWTAKANPEHTLEALLARPLQLLQPLESSSLMQKPTLQSDSSRPGGLLSQPSLTLANASGQQPQLLQLFQPLSAHQRPTHVSLRQETQGVPSEMQYQPASQTQGSSTPQDAMRPHSRRSSSTQHAQQRGGRSAASHRAAPDASEEPTESWNNISSGPTENALDASRSRKGSDERHSPNVPSQPLSFPPEEQPPSPDAYALRHGSSRVTPGQKAYRNCASAYAADPPAAVSRCNTATFRAKAVSPLWKQLRDFAKRQRRKETASDEPAYEGGRGHAVRLPATPLADASAAALPVALAAARRAPPSHAQTAREKKALPPPRDAPRLGAEQPLLVQARLQLSHPESLAG
ncbi:PAN domain-containing protein [Cyclospora cayetanensis]|uniref:PAN domain-containing protein n=1 Tax=Cyclospora cayetanensis TaxID=88456 RepID=A0A1D3D562_9EIME|nr:PAN domain-containing protein [Cyclospora cayetanensis]